MLDLEVSCARAQSKDVLGSPRRFRSDLDAEMRPVALDCLRVAMPDRAEYDHRVRDRSLEGVFVIETLERPLELDSAILWRPIESAAKLLGPVADDRPPVGQAVVEVVSQFDVRGPARKQDTAHPEEWLYVQRPVLPRKLPDDPLGEVAPRAFAAVVWQSAGSHRFIALSTL